MNKRIGTVYKNSIITLFVQVVQIILGFYVRKVFINTLGIEYLGYNSVFANILQMLNLADLGIGIAITSFLYRPIAENDEQRIAALMTLYRRIYRTIGFLVLAVGAIVSIFVEVLIPDSGVSVWYLRALFYVNLVGTVATYFLAYKRTLIVADQKSYIVNLTDGLIFVVISILQVLSLYVFSNYIFYLGLNVAKAIISNCILSYNCDKKYGRFEGKSRKEYVSEYKPLITQYVKDLFVSRIGAVVFYGTDNVIISVIKGSLLVGLLSNYTMITGYLTAIITQLLSSLQATFGNYLNSNKSIEEQRRMTDNYFCVNFLIGNFCMNCFIFIVQPFISVYFGPKLLLPFSTAIWLGINLMLLVLIQLPSQVFTIYRLFRYDRPIIIVSATLNFVISIILVKMIGIDGALIGTFITSLIYLFSRFHIIAKKVYNVSFFSYVKKILFYFLTSAITSGVILLVNRHSEVNVWRSLMVRGINVAIMAVVIPVSILSFTEEFKFLMEKSFPVKVRKLLKIVFVCLLAGSVVVNYWGSKNIHDVDETNKSLTRLDVYNEEAVNDVKVFHLSIDDTIDCFRDISENKYDTIFSNDFFSWLKNLHNVYGVVVTCYCYYEDNDFNLLRVPDIYRTGFEENSDWLRFGFHAKNVNTTYEHTDITNDYGLCMDELERIVGCFSIDNVIRLQSYCGNKENIRRLVSAEKQPIIGLFTSDDSRPSYYLDDESNKYIYCHDRYDDEELGIVLFSTDIRVEYVESVSAKLKEFNTDSWNNQLNILEVFSHEWILNLENKRKIEEFCMWANDHDYSFEFPEDIVK